MPTFYNLYTGRSSSGITIIFENTNPRSITNDHPFFEHVKSIFLTTAPEDIDESQILDLINPVSKIGAALTKLSSRVTYNGTDIFFDGDVVNNSLSGKIVTAIQNGEEEAVYQPLINFLEKISTNPNPTAVEGLYDFLSRYDFTIAPDGDFLAHKKVTPAGTSFHSGYGIVDGVVYKNSQLPNAVGSVVEFPRSRVDANQLHGCSTGLHAGSYDFAVNFGAGILLVVKINPRDVVSVPYDFAFQKIRTCRYVVLHEVETEQPATVWDRVLEKHSPENATPEEEPEEEEIAEDSAIMRILHQSKDEQEEVGFGYTKLDGRYVSVDRFMPESFRGDTVTGLTDRGYRTYVVDGIEDIAFLSKERNKEAGVDSLIDSMNVFFKAAHDKGVPDEHVIKILDEITELLNKSHVNKELAAAQLPDGEGLKAIRDSAGNVSFYVRTQTKDGKTAVVGAPIFKTGDALADEVFDALAE